MEVQQNEMAVGGLVVACLVDHPRAITLLRVARDRAADIGGKWRAVFIETPCNSGDALDGGGSRRMRRLLDRAVKMGGEKENLHADTIEEGVAKVLKNEEKQLGLLLTAEGLADQRQASAWDRATHTARESQKMVETVSLTVPHHSNTITEPASWKQMHHILYALVGVGLAVILSSMLEDVFRPALFRINNQNVGLIFLIASAFAAGRFGLLPGLVASVAGFFILNYYFTPPYYTLKFVNLTDTLNLALFLSAAVLISLFTSQARATAKKSARREQNTQALFTLYRLGAKATSRKQALEELQQKLRQMLMMDVAFFMPPALNPDGIEAAYPANIALTEFDKSALILSWKEMKTTGLASPFYIAGVWRFEPMIAPSGEVGVLGIKPHSKGQIDPWFGRLLTAIADQTATILENIELDRSMEATRIREDREKLRSMLLSSVSHDLKTPLASIIGALNIYRSQGKKLSLEKQETLIETALEESERLNSFITNILNMTHLESGRVEFKQEWGDMHSIAQHVVRRLEHRLRQRPLKMHVSLKNVEVLMDMMMMEQVLQNVLDNACKYTPSGTDIEINCIAEEDKAFVCEVRDYGSGLPNEKMERVFDKYARLQKQDSQVAGTGLGLAICKAMMEAQGGSITAANHAEGGAVFRLYLPKWRKADMTKYVA